MVFLAALSVAAGPALGDEVVLRNGDRLSGTVLHLAGGKLDLRTGYAEHIELDWRDVASLSTDAPLAGEPDLWFWMFVARLVNHPGTLAVLTSAAISNKWNPQQFIRVIENRPASSLSG